MADVTQLTFVGDWRITVTGRDASWAQRVIATGLPRGTQTLGGNPGAAIDVYGNGQAPGRFRSSTMTGSTVGIRTWSAAFRLLPARAVAGSLSRRTTPRPRAIATSTTW